MDLFNITKEVFNHQRKIFNPARDQNFTVVYTKMIASYDITNKIQQYTQSILYCNAYMALNYSQNLTKNIPDMIHTVFFILYL